jgi:hypothetical protein
VLRSFTGAKWFGRHSSERWNPVAEWPEADAGSRLSPG